MKLAYFQRCRCFMNKNDYIKILREFQNYFKNEVNQDVIFFKECNYEERLEDISEQKNEYMCKAITYYMLLYIFLQKDYKLISVLLGIFGTINLAKLILVGYYGNEFKENCLIIEKEDLYFKKEIKKIDNAIKFFQSTSEEEVQKYLSYKMGDSKKINQLYLVFFVIIRYNTYRFGSD